MSRTWIVFCLFVAAVLCGVAFLAISAETVVPIVARGVGPSGVQVTSSGWLALLTSLLGAGGFTLAGLVTAIASRFGLTLPSSEVEPLVAEVTELTASFAALMRDKSNRATQRRFVFALVDATKLIQGCETSHEAGVVVVKYRGYADPVSTTSSGSTGTKGCS